MSLYRLWPGFGTADLAATTLAISVTGDAPTHRLCHRGTSLISVACIGFSLAAKPLSAERFPAEQVDVRAGVHDTFERIVFEWPDLVGYRIMRQGDEIVIEFDRPGRFDLSLVAEDAGSLVIGARAEGDGVSRRVVLRIRPDAAYRWFDLDDNLVAIDVLEAIPMPTSRPTAFAIATATNADGALIDVTPQGVAIATAAIGSRSTDSDAREAEPSASANSVASVGGAEHAPLQVGAPMLSLGENEDTDFDELGRAPTFEVGGALVRLAQATADPTREEVIAQAKARYEAARQAMMADPTDIEKNFALADAAVALGKLSDDPDVAQSRFREAIPPLERILLIEPNRPDIKLRLGELHGLVGEHELAQVHLGQALEATELPQAIREDAGPLLERRRTEYEGEIARQRLSGSIFAGGRYETNANAGPGSNKIRVLGFEGPFLADEDKEEDDFSALALADLDYYYDFGYQEGHALEADLFLLGSRYNDVSKVNTSLTDVEIGPRIVLGQRRGSFTSVRPFATGSYLALDDDTYRKTYGGGINTRSLIDPWDMVLNTTARVVKQDFDATTKEPRASNQSGTYYTYRPEIIWESIQDTLLITVAGLIGYNDADQGFESFRELGAIVGGTYFYARPFEWMTNQRRWRTSLVGSYRNSDYNDADTLIDPDQKRDDDRFDLSFTNEIPMFDQFSLNLNFQQTWNESNLPNKEFNNTAVTTTVRYAF